MLAENSLKLAYNIVRSKFPGCKHLHDELEGVALLSLVKAERKYDPSKQKWEAFAYYEVYNDCRDFLRKEYKFIFERLIDLSYERHEREPDLLDGLSQQEQQILNMRLSNYSQMEISQKLKIHYSTISRIVKQAIQKLQEKYQVSL